MTGGTEGFLIKQEMEKPYSEGLQHQPQSSRT